MRLLDLEPQFYRVVSDVKHGGSKHEHIYSLINAHGVRFNCPCGSGHKLHIPIGDEARGWIASGAGLADLTLIPSIAVSGGKGDGSSTECWHGFVTNGEVRTV